MDLEQLKKDLAQAEQQLKDAKDQKFKYEARLDELRRTEQGKVAECHRRGLNPDDLGQEIATRLQQAADFLARGKQHLPKMGAPAAATPARIQQPALGAF